MQFSGIEISAILKLAKAMALADGKIEKVEIAVITREILRFGVEPEQLETFLAAGDAMEPAHAMAIISGLDKKQKKYVAAYLGTIMASDMDINDKEMALWQLVSTLCELPTMNVQQAVQIMADL